MFYDLGSVQMIQTRSPVRLDLWGIHLKSTNGCPGRGVEAHGRWNPQQVEADRDGAFVLYVLCHCEFFLIYLFDVRIFFSDARRTHSGRYCLGIMSETGEVFTTCK